MSILITGASGQLGSELLSRFRDRAVGVSKADCDITSPDSIQRTLDRHQPGVVINTAAFTAVDAAESQVADAFRVNAFGPHNLAEACLVREIRFIHISTDYVFHEPDRREPWSEIDPVEPASVYAVSKYAGERLILSCNPTATVLRTCGLYSSHGPNFVKTMLRLSQTMDTVRVVDDQTCSPTSTADLAIWIEAMVDQRVSGLFHATNSGQTTWAEFAEAIFAAAGASTRVERITSAEFGAKATRPVYSVLDCNKLDEACGLTRRHWRDAVTEFVAKMR